MNKVWVGFLNYLIEKVVHVAKGSYICMVANGIAY